MKKSLLLYLFIIALLMNVFTYMYFSKKSTSEQAFKQTTEKKLNDSVVVLYNKYTDANYFSLENNQNAQNYFAMNAEKPIDFTKLIPLINDKLIAFNDNPNGNPYTGQDPLDGKKFIINKAKVLNHRWVIADFSNGDYWGEVLVKYFVNADDSLSFEVIQSLIYPK